MTQTAPVPWGKVSDCGTRHPLVDHCLDVALVCRALLQLPPVARWGRLQPGQAERLAVLAYLHDFGKCNRGFQAKADPKARESEKAGHVFEALALLMELQNAWPPQWTRLITDIAGWFRDEEQACQMLVASLSHHGRPVSLSDYKACGGDAAKRWWRAASDYDPLAALDALAVAARQAFPEAFTENVPPIDATPEFQQRFAGLVMLADWIGSDTQFFPYRASDDQDRRAFATQAAQRALRAIGLSPPEPRAPKPFAEVFPFQPTELQRALAETLEPSDDTRLLLAESDTGSGKTEAALAWFFRLYAEGHVDGLYFALPTRVAARELYERVRRAVEAAFEPDARPSPVLLAAPGYVKVDGEPVLPNPQGVLWDDSEPDQKRERLWSAERPKRFLAAPIAVGTIDQALLSVLQVKHSLLRSVCLDRHLLVVDEVHASDPYMREVLRALLEGHVGRGGWALLLSATLGESAAAPYFERAAVPLNEAIARPYPLLSSRTGAWPMPAARERQIAVELSPTLTDDDALLPRLIAALEAGARVLVVCNTVTRANALFRRVESALEAQPELLPALFAVSGVRCPHHGRFAREDREWLDEAVTAQLGKGLREGAKLLIGTQTLEQSLDIDADWVITDLAPMDVLIQRLGRLHRHAGRLRPPGFEAPRALVRVPDKELIGYLDKNDALRAPAGLGSVYADGRVLACTWAELRRDPRLVLPQQARERIERTTHTEAFQTLGDAWRAHGQSIEGREGAELRQALRSVLDGKPFGELHYPDQGERVLTRLGDPTFDIPLETPMRSPFGADMGRVSIPARWLKGATVPESVRAEPTADGFRFAIGHQGFRYTRFGLEKDDA
ncbi:CRISPR-associated helicase Cas3' [Caldimonas taiwanensis]|uniref:CRISPR-associated helicase Cas3' n=1 Tax=Caldimonas taiwanensis TaxID=307483 RepID=UPI000A9ADF6E|nr:CRISPR-associated helicase Cas3' [Caldimonas taiwanensis]